MKLTSLIKKMNEELITKTRGDGSTYIAVEDQNSLVWEIVYNVHDGCLPNDYIFKAIYDIINRFMEYIEELDTLEKYEQEQYLHNIVAEIEPEIYTNKLLHWLSSNLTFCDYIQEALETGDIHHYGELFMRANMLFLQDIGEKLINELIEHSE